MIRIDGSQGEGGGQVLRTCLSLSALTGRPFHLRHIRANRRKPGLRPQHLTAVRAAAAICQAHVSGDHLNASTLEFHPQVPPTAGAYTFDVTQAAQGGSAGAVTLIFQAVLWPLLFAAAPTQLTLRGGTHVPFSPPFHYLTEVFGPAVARLGAAFSANLTAWGWYPMGGGEMIAIIQPIHQLTTADLSRTAVAHARVRGLAAVTNLPADIPQRMARRADNLLRQAKLLGQVTAVRERGLGPGAGIFLWLPQAGFSSLGRKGLPADKVAETAVAECRAFMDNGADVDKRLADQLLLPLALAHGRSHFTTDQITQHTLTNVALLRDWLNVSITIVGELNQPGAITIEGIGYMSSRNP
ncbi:MAG: RNA 3'-phosphate cyclase [Chloroflexi bacterium]|nr:RNA 3'-phosphate cyclase [Chloroflexota bacterium]